MNAILKGEAGAALRISVKGGGCSGFQYAFDVEKTRAEDDVAVTRDGATVLVDPVSLEMLKGADMSKQEKEFKHMEAMICGMTPQERRTPQILNAKRRQRIAKGSGVTVTELNTMLNKFAQMQQMMKKMGKFQKMMARMGGGAAGMMRR